MQPAIRSSNQPLGRQWSLAAKACSHSSQVSVSVVKTAHHRCNGLFNQNSLRYLAEQYYSFNSLSRPSNLSLTFTNSPVNDPAPVPGALVLRVIHTITVVHAS